MAMVALAVAIAVPFLPQSFTGRMSTIQTYEADASASTRLAVWAWTWDYAKKNPLGGGFEAYRQNSRSEEHTSELQSLMRISYAVLCLKKNNIISQSSPGTY